MLIHFFIIPNLMAKHHARRDGAAWLIPVLAHPAHKNGHMVARQPHVLARRAHRIDRSGQGWMVCRVPVALLTATGDDARSLRRPGHQPEKKRKDHAVPACPLLCQFQPRPEPGSPIQAGRARLTRPRGRAPLMCAAVTRARPDHFGLSQQAEADRRTPTMWGMGRAAAGLPLVTAARRACAERNASPCRP